MDGLLDRDTYTLILLPSHLTTFGGLKQILSKVSQKDYMHSNINNNCHLNQIKKL